LINFSIAGRITAHKALPHTSYWRGFLFLLMVPMTDKVQAKQDLEFCSAELSKYQNLSRSGLKRHQMIAIDEIMIELKERIRNLRNMLEN
jgi:hypothetical protein